MNLLIKLIHHIICACLFSICECLFSNISIFTPLDSKQIQKFWMKILVKMHLYQHRQIHRPAGFHLENLASSQALQKSDKKSNFIQVSKALSPMNEQVSFSLPEMLDPRQFWNVGKNRYALSIYYCLVKATHGTSRTVKHQKFLNFWLDMLKLIDN